MSEINIIEIIQKEKRKNVVENGKPEINEETIEVMSKKRMTLDEPPHFRKQDPLR